MQKTSMFSAGNPIAMIRSVIYVKSKSNSSVTKRRFFFETCKASERPQIYREAEADFLFEIQI